MNPESERFFIIGVAKLRRRDSPQLAAGRVHLWISRGYLMHYTRDDIISAFMDSGLARGDIVFLSTSLGMLGVAEGVSTPDELNQLFLDCIKTVLGPEGTILVPTYSYTFGRSTATDSVIYDPETTPSEIGSFPEFFRKQPGVIRSLDPMISVAGCGPSAYKLFKCLPPTSYGAGCIFDRLTKTKAKCCNIALGPNWTPFVHYVNWLANVPFRYEKLFAGNIMVNGKPRKRTWVYAVRILSEPSLPNTYRLGKMAENAGIWKSAPLGRGRIYAADYRAYFDFAVLNQKTDPWLTAVGPPADLVDLEEKRVGTQRKHSSLPEGSSCRDIAQTLAPLVRETVSDGMDMAFNILAEQLPMTIHRYPTGMNCFDWIVPEKWTCHGAALQRINGETVLSYEENRLFVRSYSMPYDGEVIREDLLRHIEVHSSIPEAIPYKKELLERDWGFCCSQKLRDGLTDERYKVDIRTNYSYGELKVGEVTVPGNSSEIILICTYLDHPCQMNVALSGVLAGMDIIRARMNAKRPRFSYRLLVLSGAPGFAAWLSQNKAMIPSIVGGVSLRMLARPLPHILQHSTNGDTMLDNVCESVLKERDTESQIVIAPEVFNEFPGGGNPLYNNHGGWGNFPMLSLVRALPQDDIDFPYKGYLTDLDNIESADFNAIEETVSVVTDIFDALESTG